MKGRKRWFLVDTEGWVTERYVDAADVADGDGGREPVQQAHQHTPRIALLWLDGGFQEGFCTWVQEATGWRVEVVSQAPDQRGFQVQPRRWVVERTIAWCSHQRRLAKDYQEQEESVEAWIDLTMIGLMARRIVRLAK